MPERKKIKIILRIIGLILILFSTLFSFYIFYLKYSDKKETEKIIEEVFENSDPTVIVESEIVGQETIEEEIPKKNDIILTNDYLGYIEISNYNIKRLITSGTEKKLLDKGLVGTLSVSANLDDDFGNVILAGHSTSNVFNNLHHIKIGNQIKIVSHKSTYYYYITEKITINDNDMSYFKQVNDKKILTLITCKNNNKQRLLVIAELRG